MFKKIRIDHMIVGGALIIVLMCLGIVTLPSQLQAFQSPLPTPESQISQPPYCFAQNELRVWGLENK